MSIVMQNVIVFGTILIILWLSLAPIENKVKIDSVVEAGNQITGNLVELNNENKRYYVANAQDFFSKISKSS